MDDPAAVPGPERALDVALAPGLELLRTEWTALADRAGGIFGTWEWNEIWWRHFGAGRPLVLAECRRDGELRAVLPLHLASTRPLRVLRFLGTGPGDHLGPVCAPEDRVATAQALRVLLGRRPQDWQLLMADRLSGEDGWPGLLGGTFLQREASPVLATEGMSWEEYLSSRSSNFRQQVRRRERQLQKAGRLTYRLAEDPGRLARDMETFFHLHELRWGSESGALEGARRGFHLEFAAAALQRGWLRLWIMELDDQPVAAWYGFRYGGAQWYYNAGRDPSYDRLRIGFVLLVHTIRDAFEDGLRCYQHLRGGEEYKDRFSSADPGIETRALARGVAGRAALAAIPRLAARPKLRKRFLRMAG